MTERFNSSYENSAAGDMLSIKDIRTMLRGQEVPADWCAFAGILWVTSDDAIRNTLIERTVEIFGSTDQESQNRMLNEGIVLNFFGESEDPTYWQRRAAGVVTPDG